MRKSGVFLGTAAIAVLGAISLSTSPACTVQGKCEYSERHYCDSVPGVACEGHLVDAHTWESTAVGGTWLDFPGERGIYIRLFDAVSNQLADGQVYEVIAYISTSNRPDRPDPDGTQFTIAGGNLAVIKNLGGSYVYVQNDTCADYFVKVVVHTEPRDSGVADSSKE